MECVNNEVTPRNQTDKRVIMDRMYIEVTLVTEKNREVIIIRRFWMESECQCIQLKMVSYKVELRKLYKIVSIMCLIFQGPQRYSRPSNGKRSSLEYQMTCFTS